MIASDKLALLLPLILAPRHPETTRGPRATASCKYFTTPIASDILAQHLPLILAPRHPETTRGPRTTASCKYFTTPHPIVRNTTIVGRAGNIQES